MIKLALFASGSGSNVEKIFEYFNNHSQILVDSIFCNNPKAYVIDRAKNLGIDSIIFDQSKTSDEDLLKMLQSMLILMIHVLPTFFIFFSVIEGESGEAWDFEEGCLSIPHVRGDVSRKSVIKITYFDESWNKKTEEYDNMRARVIQLCILPYIN